MNSLQTLIHTEIRDHGPMNMAHFMTLALYHPEWGYYSSQNTIQHIGKKGDFFTNVSVGPLFGKLLAAKFAKLWRELGSPTPFNLIECGGLDGQLAKDILSSLSQDATACYHATHYVFVEPLTRLQAFQKKILERFPQIGWIHSFHELKCEKGVIFGNELLDAFPVHQIEFISNQWFECHVDIHQDSLILIHQPCSSFLSRGLPERPVGRIEVCPQATEWLQNASTVLTEGYILLIDYGWTDEEYFQKLHPQGALRSYKDHRLVENILADPGEQDITSHVRWTPFLEKSKQLGLATQELIHQGRWLTQIFVENPQKLSAQEIRQFHTLTHPEIMGTPFRVLTLKKGG